MVLMLFSTSHEMCINFNNEIIAVQVYNVSYLFPGYKQEVTVLNGNIVFGIHVMAGGKQQMLGTRPV